MAINALWLKVEGERLLPALQQAVTRLDGADGELVLDFSAVRRITPEASRELENLAGVADEKAVKLVLRGVNIDVYRVLKLAKLTARFSFRS